MYKILTIFQVFVRKVFSVIWNFVDKLSKVSYDFANERK